MKSLQSALIFVLALFALQTSSAIAGTTLDSPLKLTESRFRQVPCMDEQRFRYHRDTLRALSYTKMRALRVFCTLPAITADEAIDALQRLVFYPLTFDQIKVLESFAGLPSVSVDDCWQLLAQTSGLEFTLTQAVNGLAGIQASSGASVLSLIDSLKNLEDSGRWAAQALFSIRPLDETQAQAGLTALAIMTEHQRNAAERASRLKGITAGQLLELFTRLETLADADALNGAALMTDTTISFDQASWWLDYYFIQPLAEQQIRFNDLTRDQKSTLLTAFSGGARLLIRTINDLHAVTDRYGSEISTGSLAAAGGQTLRELFARLHRQAQERYQATFDRALAEGRTYDAIDALKNATALARKLTARDLSSANIYVLLSHGSELYDSSFRDILVPVMLDRISQSFNGSLLPFLAAIDPASTHVSDFIVSCAQKGKLTAFFPADTADQERIIDLMAASAFQNEQSLILFAATFNTLLEKLQPDVRSYLVDRIIGTIKQPESTFALQLRVILQFYRDKHPGLLGENDRRAIDTVIKRYGQIDFAPYIRTDFRRWKQDGRLGSLSIFQNDDDGKISYLSNSRHLIKSGYQPRLSQTLALLPSDSPTRKQAETLLAQERKHPGTALGPLFRLSTAAPVIVEWFKKVNGLQISHAVAVYQNPAAQRQLLKLFLDSDMELFAQRGHSYWREEQLLEPMRQLLEHKEISDATISRINRFMSIGSCGGLRVYSELNRLFNNQVDIFATVGTGKAIVNDPYNQQLFEIIAGSGDQMSWEEIARQSASILSQERTSDYLQPGSLPAILHKMMDIRKVN